MVYGYVRILGELSDDWDEEDEEEMLPFDSDNDEHEYQDIDGNNDDSWGPFLLQMVRSVTLSQVTVSKVVMQMEQHSLERQQRDDAQANSHGGLMKMSRIPESLDHKQIQYL